MSKKGCSKKFIHLRNTFWCVNGILCPLCSNNSPVMKLNKDKEPETSMRVTEGSISVTSGSPFILSGHEIDIGMGDLRMYPIWAVKEFIRLLKEEICNDNVFAGEVNREIIDKLSGFKDA